jgi:hypothetical protein
LVEKKIRIQHDQYDQRAEIDPLAVEFQFELEPSTPTSESFVASQYFYVFSSSLEFRKIPILHEHANVQSDDERTQKTSAVLIPSEMTFPEHEPTVFPIGSDVKKRTHEHQKGGDVKHGFSTFVPKPLHPFCQRSSAPVFFLTFFDGVSVLQHRIVDDEHVKIIAKPTQGHGYFSELVLFDSDVIG